MQEFPMLLVRNELVEHLYSKFQVNIGRKQAPPESQVTEEPEAK